MNPFSYTRAADVPTAVGEVAANAGARFIAGGTNLIDLMKENVERPSRLVDINRLPLAAIQPGPDGGLRLGARVVAVGPGGERRIPFADFHRLPGDTPERDANLEPDEIITAIELLSQGFAENYSYLKVRDRLSYAFALVSVAVGLRLAGDTVAEARIALGGVAHKPWREPEAESLLAGRPASGENFARAAERLLRGARGFGHNDFKIALAKRAITRALAQAARGTPQSQSDKRIA